jgi:heavy metal sensor kinase
MTGRGRYRIRTRLAFWYGAAVAVTVLAYAAGVYTFVGRSFREALDRTLHEDFETVEQVLDRDGAAAVPSVRHEDDQDLQATAAVEVWNERDRPPLRSVGASTPPMPAGVGDTYAYVSVRGADGESRRTITGRHTAHGTPYIIRASRSEARVGHELTELASGLAMGVPIVVLLAALGGYHLAGRALRPVDAMTAQAAAITADRLRERLPVENAGDELGRLALVFNDMLQRLEDAFDRLRRFTADASHELRTPLTAIRSVGEVGLREARTPAAYRDTIGSMLEETDRLTTLVESLLFLSRADSGRTLAGPERIPLLAFSSEVAGHLAVLADERRQRIEVEGDASLEAHADPVLLRPALVNVVDNAIKHSPQGAAIRIVVAATSDTEVVIAVQDSGPGIPPEHRDRVFERFYRVDEGRARDRGGSGLGLAIARWAVEANGGAVELESEMGRGSTFRLRLPRYAAVAGAGSSRATRAQVPVA